MQPLKSSAGWRALQEEREALISEAQAFAERVKKALPDARVFLYGSAARGDFNLRSDLDLLVVSDGLPRGPLKRPAFLYRFVEGREEPKGLLVGEFEKLKGQNKLWFLEGAVEL